MKTKESQKERKKIEKKRKEMEWNESDKNGVWERNLIETIVIHFWAEIIALFLGLLFS